MTSQVTVQPGAHTHQTGYLHPAYAQSLAECGTPLHLPRSGAIILRRAIPGTPYEDAMGCYPLFMCNDWKQLKADVVALSESIISLVAVTDPFGHYEPHHLVDCFRDHVAPFKSHYVRDLRVPLATSVSSHHAYYARRALKLVTVHSIDEPLGFLAEWCDLYGILNARHSITGLAAFSPQSFKQQLTVPGLHAFRAVCEGTAVGMHLWFQHGDMVYHHLAAYSELGYKVAASYALMWRAIEYFTVRNARWLDLGGVAGPADNTSNGLARFKAGWSSGYRQSYLCGRINNHDRYHWLAHSLSCDGSYFPAYRCRSH